MNKEALFTTLPYFIPTILLMSYSLVHAQLYNGHEYVQHVLQADNLMSTVMSVVHSRIGLRVRNPSKCRLTQRYARYWICDMSAIIAPGGMPSLQ
jgi:hypothetical protein